MVALAIPDPARGVVRIHKTKTRIAAFPAGVKASPQGFFGTTIPAKGMAAERGDMTTALTFATKVSIKKQKGNSDQAYTLKKNRSLNGPPASIINLAKHGADIVSIVTSLIVFRQLQHLR